MLQARRRLAVVVLVSACVAAILLYWPAAAYMVAAWRRSGTFTHGFAVAPISLYVIWTRREQLAHVVPMENPWALPLLPFIALVWLIGYRTDVLVLQELALVGALQVLTWVIMGTAVSRLLFFPLAFLFFAVPIGEELIPPMQDLTSLFAAHALRLSGVLVSWEGRVLLTPTGEWHVAEACSGVRYLIPAVVLGCLYSALTYRRWSRRVIFVLLCIAVPILANGVRAYGIIMLAHLTNNRIAVGVDHQIYGWFFFGVIMYPLFTLGRRWQDLDSSPSLRFESIPDVPRSTSMILVAGCSVLLLAIAPAAARISAGRIERVSIEAKPPAVQSPWRAASGHVSNWKPTYSGPAAEVLQTYQSASGDVDLYIGYYVDEQQGSELVNSENRLSNNKSWTTARERQRAILLDGQTTLILETTLRSSEGKHRLVWSWYWVANEFTSSASYAKFLQARAKLFGGPMGAAIVAVSSEYDTALPPAAARLRDFLHCSAPWRQTLSAFAKSAPQPAAMRSAERRFDCG